MFKRIFGLLFFVVLLLWSEFSDPCFTLFTLKAQEETKEVIPEPYEKGIPVETLSTLRSLFNELNHFPKPEAKKACKKLLEYGDMVIPIVDHYLRNGNWREKTAMAFIAQDLQSKALLRSLNYAAQDPEIKDLQYFFEAFLSSDLLPGQHLILQFLKHSKSSVRWLATRTLLPVLQPDLKEPLFELLESKEISDKTNIIRLLGTYRDPKVIPYFTKYLNHANPETCIQASQELSRFNHEELIQILMGNLNHSDFRLKGYSVLTLVALQDQFKVQLFDEDAYLAFLKDLRSLQDFIRFIAAIALSTINQSDLDITFKEEDEQALLQALIDACMGNRYFKDYQAVRSVGLEKLQKLTGKNFRADPVEWKKWWDSHKGSFHLLKKLRSVSPSQVETVQVFYQTEGNQTRTFLFSVKAVESLVQDFPLAQVRILANSEMMELIQKFEEMGFFTMKSHYGIAESDVGWIRTLKVIQETQERSVSVRTGFHHQEFETLELFLEDWIKKQAWQKYWSRSYDADWRDWWYTNYHWYQAATDPLEILTRTKALLIENLPYSLHREEHLQDLKELILIAKNSPEIQQRTSESLSIWELSRLVQFLTQQKQLSATTGFLVECFCISQNEKVLEPLFGYFLQDEIYGSQARTYLSQLIESFGKEAVLRYLVDSDWRLRSASAEIAWKDPFAHDLSIQALLRKRLSPVEKNGEPLPSVRQSIIYAIGLHGKSKKDESDPVEELYIRTLRDLQHHEKITEEVYAHFQTFSKIMQFRYESFSNPGEQQNLIAILKKLFGESQVEATEYALKLTPSTLLNFQKEEVIELKKVLDLSKNWDVSLLEEQLKVNDPSIVRTTIRALGYLGTERSLSLVTEYLASTDPSYRAEAINALGSTQDRQYLVPIINGLIRDPSQRVNQIAQQVLAQWGGKRVVEALLKELLSSDKPSTRKKILEAFHEFAPKSILSDIKPYLQDEDFQIRILCAALFAKFNETGVVPVLIENIGKGNDYLVFQSLSMLTCQNFKGNPENVSIIYKKWWEENRLLSQRQWFFNALKDLGYPVDELFEFMSGNDRDFSGVPILLKALKDPQWYIRYNASFALEILSEIPNNRMSPQSTAEDREKQLRIWYQWWEKQSPK